MSGAVSDQLALAADCCKVRDCPHPIAGSSITGEGKVCSSHNSIEWGKALTRPGQPDWIRELGTACLGVGG